MAIRFYITNLHAKAVSFLSIYANSLVCFVQIKHFQRWINGLNFVNWPGCMSSPSKKILKIVYTFRLSLMNTLT